MPAALVLRYYTYFKVACQICEGELLVMGGLEVRESMGMNTRPLRPKQEKVGGYGFGLLGRMSVFQRVVLPKRIDLFPADGNRCVQTLLRREQVPNCAARLGGRSRRADQADPWVAGG